MIEEGEEMFQEDGELLFADNEEGMNSNWEVNLDYFRSKSVFFRRTGCANNRAFGHEFP
jgi:hypothetical protein